MTSDFDELMFIHEKSKENPKLKKLAEWIADICVSEANTRKPGWDFYFFKNSPRGRMLANIHGEEELKWFFLDACHYYLDHTHWHLKVFEIDTRFLIDAVYNLLKGVELSKQELKKNVKRHYPKLMELLREIGIEEDKHFIKLKEVDG
jgi:hypothetical protein